jgi:hypothetical protein
VCAIDIVEASALMHDDAREVRPMISPRQNFQTNLGQVYIAPEPCRGRVRGKGVVPRGEHRGEQCTFPCLRCPCHGVHRPTDSSERSRTYEPIDLAVSYAGAAQLLTRYE